MMTRVEKIIIFMKPLRASVQFVAALLVSLLLAVPFQVQAATAETPQPLIFSDDNLALLDLQFGQYRIGDGVDAYVVNDKTYLPLADMFHLLGIKVTVTASGAAGWFISEDRNFRLLREAAGWKAEVMGFQLEVAEQRIVNHYDILYGDSELFKEWFDIDVMLNFSLSLLEIDTDENFPFKAKLERGKRNANRRVVDRPAEDPWLREPYVVAEIPSLSVNLNHSTQRNEKLDTDTETRTTYSVLSHGDLAYMSTELFLSGDREQDLTGGSIRMNRFDHTESMFGPLRASQLSLGDIQIPGLGASSGRGLLISNEDVTRSSNSGVTNIEGEFHPGWDVELYHNNILVAKQELAADGRYNFTDIALFLGNNLFLLKFFGPNGEEKSEERNLFLGHNADDVGKLRYSFALSQPNLRAFNIDDVNEIKPEYEQVNLNAFYGLTQSVGLTSELMHTEDHGSRFRLGLQASHTNKTLRLQAEGDEDGNTDLGLSLNGSLKNLRYQFGATKYAEDDLALDPQDYKLRFALSGLYRKNSVTLTADLEQRQHSQLGRYDLGLSGSVAGFNWSNTLRYRNLDDDMGYTEDMQGNFNISRSMKYVSVRLSQSYDVIPYRQLDTTSFDSHFRIDDDTSLNFGVSRVEDGDTSYSLGLSWQLPYMQVTPRVSYNENGDISGIISIQASLGKRANDRGTYYQPNKFASSRGTIRARLFEDRNRDGFYSVDEPLVEGGTLVAEQFHRTGSSDAEGNIWFENLTPWKPSDIVFEDGSGSNKPMRYAGKPFSLATRPGSLTTVNVPLQTAGEISGAVYRQEASGRAVARSVVLRLLDLHGKEVASALTDRDGFFILEFVAPGHYRLVADNEVWVKPEDAEFEYSGEEAFLDVADLLLPPLDLSAQISVPAVMPVAALEIDAAVESFKTGTVELMPPFLPSVQSPAVEIESEPQVVPPAVVRTDIAASASVSPEPKRWRLQVVSLKNLSSAKALKQRLAERNFSAIIHSVDLNKGRFYRVLVGSEANRAALAGTKRQVDAMLKVKSFPVLSAR